MITQIVPATEQHAEELARDMRTEDVIEVHASGGYSPLEAALSALDSSSDATTLLFDDNVAAMFGIAPMATGLGVSAVWLLTATLVEKYPKRFMELSRVQVARLLGKAPYLVNAIDARYASALRWAAWLGFTIADPIPFGRSQLPFHHIALTREAFLGSRAMRSWQRSMKFAEEVAANV